MTGNVEIGAKSSVWPMVSIRGDMHQIKIGERTNIQDGSILHVTPDSNFFPGGKPLIIGDNELDNCGTCDNDSSNECVQDCNGTWGGT